MNRTNKEKLLKDNVDKCTQRTYNEYRKTNKKEMPDSEKVKVRKEFEGAARNIDKNKLSDVWNGDPEKRTSDSRPEFGYFGGVNFDKNGKIIR